MLVNRIPVLLAAFVVAASAFMAVPAFGTGVHKTACGVPASGKIALTAADHANVADPAAGDRNDALVLVSTDPSDVSDQVAAGRTGVAHVAATDPADPRDTVVTTDRASTDPADPRDTAVTTDRAATDPATADRETPDRPDNSKSDSINAKDDDRPGYNASDRFWFSGGMSVHVGYSIAENTRGPVDGLIAGLGGRAYFEGLPHFRVGLGGATTHVSYQYPGLEGSYFSVGYGGLILEGWYRYKFFKLSAGGLVGYGGVKNLHIISAGSGSTQITDYREYGSWIFVPAINFEFFVMKRLAVVITVDHLLGTSIGDSFQLGTRFHVGILFYR